MVKEAAPRHASRRRMALKFYFFPHVAGRTRERYRLVSWGVRQPSIPKFDQRVTRNGWS